jgi:ribosomal protein L40E
MASIQIKPLQKGLSMYLKVTYGWFTEENRGKTEELDKALQDTLDELGFFQTKARFDMATGERRLEFETEESFIRDVLVCPHCGKKNPQYYKKCWKCRQELDSGTF